MTSDRQVYENIVLIQTEVREFPHYLNNLFFMREFFSSGSDVREDRINLRVDGT